MTDIIRTIAENGQGKLFYDIFFALGFVSVFIFCFVLGKKYKIATKKIVFMVLTVYPISVVWMFIMPWMESGFRHFGANNIVRVFVYIPLIAYPVAKRLKIEWSRMCDLLAIGPVAVHGISHFGCIFFGCCYGYPSSWGIYNPVKEQILFPSQPFEALTAVLIIIILLVRAKKKNYVSDGLAYPIMLILFGSTRFIWEFFRDNEKLWLGCSSFSFHALFMMIAGIIAYVIIKRKQLSKEKARINTDN